MAERKRAAKAVAEPPVTEPQPGQPHPVEQPPAEAQTRGASNQTGQLPHNAAAGCSRAAAYFEAIAEESGSGGGHSLSKISAWALSGLEDVLRFTPDAMRAAARDEAAL